MDHFKPLYSHMLPCAVVCLVFIQWIECLGLFAVAGTWRALENNFCIRQDFKWKCPLMTPLVQADI